MKKIINLKEEIIPLSRNQHLGLIVLIACVFQFGLFFSTALAEKTENISIENYSIELSSNNIEEASNLKEVLNKYTFPSHNSLVELYNENEYTILSSTYHTMTAYNSEPGQTDSTPCITANGFNVCEHMIEDTVAANFLKFGTKIRIPELFGDRIFIVRDRMNSRYTSRVDIWMIDKQDALNFGIKNTKIEILIKK